MIRTTALTFAIAITCASSAQDYFGTKSDAVKGPPTPTNVGPGWMQMVQLFVAVAVVLVLLRWLLPKVVAKSFARSQVRGGKSIAIEDSLTIGGVPVHILTIDSRRLLVSGGPNGLSLIADITPNTNVTENPAFFEVLDQESSRPKTSNNSEDVLAQLERLGQ